MLPSILLLLLFFVAQLVALVLTVVFFMPEISVAPLDLDALMNFPPVGFGISLFVTELLLSVGIYIWYRRDRLKDVPVAVTEADSLRLTVLSCAATLLLALGLSFLFIPLGLDDGGTQAIFEQQKDNVFCLALLCLVGPACEELLFRAGITRVLFRRGLPAWSAATLAAFCFALFHGNWQQGLPAFLIGIVFGLFFLRTRDLRLCLPAHILNNVLGVLLLSFPALNDAAESLPLWADLALGTLLTVGGIIVLLPVVRPVWREKVVISKA
ncbi:MAG: lysostaphin resistance A-like protein [Alloprevotella sp.]